MVKQGDIMMNPIRLLIQGDHKIKVKVRKKIRAFILKKKKKRHCNHYDKDGHVDDKY